jgi:hypothetical protein
VGLVSSRARNWNIPEDAAIVTMMNIDVTKRIVDHSMCPTITENAPSPVTHRTMPATPIPKSAVAVLFTFSEDIAM